MLKRQPLKRSKPLQVNSSLKKKSPIKKKAPTPEQVQERKENSEKMWELFNRHWELKRRKIYDYSGHICEECEEQILGENKSIYHHHMLPKARYEEYKYDIDNLILLCGDCHQRVENGYPGPVVERKTKYLREKYGII